MDYEVRPECCALTQYRLISTGLLVVEFGISRLTAVPEVKLPLLVRKNSSFNVRNLCYSIHFLYFIVLESLIEITVRVKRLVVDSAKSIN